MSKKVSVICDTEGGTSWYQDYLFVFLFVIVLNTIRHPRQFDIYSLCRLKGSARIILRWGVLLIRRNTGSVWPSPFFLSYFSAKGNQSASTCQIWKYAAASALSQTLLLCRPSPLLASTAFALLLVCQGITGTQGLMGKCISHFVPLCIPFLLLKISIVCDHHVSCMIPRHFSHCDTAVRFCYITSK